LLSLFQKLCSLVNGGIVVLCSPKNQTFLFRKQSTCSCLDDGCVVPQHCSLLHKTINDLFSKFRSSDLFLHSKIKWSLWFCWCCAASRHFIASGINGSIVVWWHHNQCELLEWYGLVITKINAIAPLTFCLVQCTLPQCHKQWHHNQCKWVWHCGITLPIAEQHLAVACIWHFALPVHCPMQQPMALELMQMGVACTSVVLWHHSALHRVASCSGSIVVHLSKKKQKHRPSFF